jgi:hypothetical protein
MDLFYYLFVFLYIRKCTKSAIKLPMAAKPPKYINGLSSGIDSLNIVENENQKTIFIIPENKKPAKYIKFSFLLFTLNLSSITFYFLLYINR